MWTDYEMRKKHIQQELNSADYVPDGTPAAAEEYEKRIQEILKEIENDITE